MVRVVCSCICNVVQHLLSIQAIALRYCKQTNRTEGTFGINVQALALSSTHRHRKLTSDGEGMTNLGFPRSELAKKLGNSARLDTA